VQAARRRPNQAFEWHHLGGGAMLLELQRQAKAYSVSNIQYHFHGNLPHEEVLAFYRDNPVDIFINTSQSEGIPVSIMEAQSYGIPCIAPRVGGVPEIVTPDNGYLLNANPSPSDIADAVEQLMDCPESLKKKKTASRENWYRCYNAQSNYQEFSQRLEAISS